MKTKTRSLWGAGLVSIHQKYVLKAIKLGEDLEITCKGATKKIPLAELEKATPRGTPFRDKITGEEYHIYDFFWNKY